ncbi:MAG: LysM peptidoglycan-binding domain-containing protein [Pseudomonadales bacterium]
MRQLTTAIVAVSISGALWASPALVANPPSEYIVKKGDTLWDISAVFLKSPWRWQEIWNINQQIKNPDLIYPRDVIYLQYHNGKPYLSKHKKGVVKLSPKVRIIDKYAALSAIPYETLKAFIEEGRILPQHAVASAPYVVANSGAGEMMTKGDSVFLRGKFDLEYPLFDIFRQIHVHIDAADEARKSVELVKVGEIEISDVNGELSTGVVTAANDVIRPSDVLLPSVDEIPGVYNLSAAPSGVAGKIIRATGIGSLLARYDGVVINLGKQDAVAPGHVFKILQPVKTVVDPNTQQTIEIASQSAGNLVVVNAFDHLSYAVILNATAKISSDYRIVSVR